MRERWKDELAKMYPDKDIFFDESMKKYTTYKIGGTADVIVYPRSLSKLEETISFAHTHKIPYFILGNGSNILVQDAGIRGIVTSLKRGFDTISITTKEQHRFSVRAEAGVEVKTLLNFSIKNELAGFEFAVGIPGSIGGAIKTNAGTRTGDFSRITTMVEVFECNGKLKKRANNELGFTYRSTNLKPGEIIIGGIFDAEREHKADIVNRLRNIYCERRLKQPLASLNAGSVFKNPAGTSAGFLMEKAGLKGMTIGDAQISPQHCNFIVNMGNANARDVLALISKAQERVDKIFNISLELEIEVIGEG
ncbi:MAG: UDP-N-acetylmuramate dehydrogenase [Thermodesulfobacteriota bacterium]|nr:UDP-N-acetylmuramate dehydrogenase [Thermodesulfobacteriota bacterium]